MRILPILGLAALAAGACRSDHVDSSDPGAVVMANGQVRYVGSLDNDDDDGDGKPDLKRRGPPPAAENNLRELRFFVPGAKWVFVAEPQNLSKQKSAVGDKIRVWDGTKKAPFQFGRLYPTSAVRPLTIYVEGIRESGLDEIGMEYQYFADQAMHQTVGGGASKSAVVRVSFAGGGRARGLTPRQKILATGRIATVATVSPTIPGAQYLWSYDAPPIAGTFDPHALTMLASHFIADTQWTRTQDRDSARFRVTDPRAPAAPIALSEVLNVVAPRSVTPNPAALPNQGGMLSNRRIVNQHGAANAHFRLFRWRVVYTVLDQFGASVYDAERGGATVEVREDVPIGSPIPTLNAWFTTSTTTPNWKAILTGGTFPDQLVSDRGDGIPYTTVLDAHLHLLPTAGQEMVTMGHHVWHVTVDRARAALDKRVTDNALQVHVDSVRAGPPEEAFFTSRYTIRLTP